MKAVQFFGPMGKWKFSQAWILVVLCWVTVSVVWAQDVTLKSGTTTPGSPPPSQSPTAMQPAPVSKQSADYEDWTTPGLETSHLVAVPPLVGEKNEFEEFTRELLQVRWREGDPIDLYVIKPKGVTKPPTILYLYGHPADSDRFQNDDFCNLLVKGGFAAVGLLRHCPGTAFMSVP